MTKLTRKLLPAIATAAILAAAPAHAESGLTLGLQSAYAIPLGTAGDGTSLSDLSTGSYPFQLDIGYRLDRRWQVGAYLGYGPASLADDARRTLAAAGATDIRGHALMRLGLQATYDLAPEARFAPWVGLGVGYEWLRYASAKVPTAGGTADEELGLRGFDATVQLGGDYRLTPSFRVGPFAALSVGRYTSTVSEVVPSVDIADRAFHAWLQVGLRGAFNL